MSNSIPTSGVTATSSTTTTTSSSTSKPPAYEDLWSINFSNVNFVQHKLRLVKVDGNSFIAFSKYFFNPIAQAFQPTKKQYFIPEQRWGELQKGLVGLYNFINNHRQQVASESTNDGDPFRATGSRTPGCDREPGTGTERCSCCHRPAIIPKPTSAWRCPKCNRPASDNPSHKRGRGRPPKSGKKQCIDDDVAAKASEEDGTANAERPTVKIESDEKAATADADTADH